MQTKREEMKETRIEDRPDFINKVIHEGIKEAAEAHCGESEGYTECHKAHAREVRDLLRKRRDVRQEFARLSEFVGLDPVLISGTVDEGDFQFVPDVRVSQVACETHFIPHLHNYDVSREFEEPEDENAISVLGFERYRELVRRGFGSTQIQRIMHGEKLTERLKILSKWLVGQKRKYWNQVTEMRCDEFRRDETK